MLFWSIQTYHLLHDIRHERINKADTPVERVWDVCINGERFWLSFNDFGLGVSLDSQMRQSSKHITAIRDRLQEWINAEDDRPI
jgi:hypothetical protein